MITTPTKMIIPCLMGPTACGKTALAMKIAKQFPIEIISVDSALIYQQMDIGTAKPSVAELATVPHHLINIKKINEVYSAADFATDALQAIADILQRQKIPLLVGGTMLYFKALQQPLADLPQADLSVRQQILQEAKLQGWPSLHEKLAGVDAAAAARIHPNDAQRIERALAIYQMTGNTQTKLWQQAAAEELPYDFKNFAILPSDRSVLHERIAQRFDAMLAQGLVAEAQQLMQQYPYDEKLPAMRAVGYRQIWQYLTGAYDYDTMRDKAIVATRQLAKRQITWARSWPNLCYLPQDLEQCHEVIASWILQHYQSVLG